MRPLVSLVGPRRSWLVVLLGLVLAGLAMTLTPAPTTSEDTASNLPADSESARAADRLAALPSSDEVPAIVVVSRPGGDLTKEDLGSLRGLTSALDGSAEGEVSGPVPAEDSSAVLFTVPLPGDLTDEENGAVVDDVRATVAKALPDGLRGEVTGGPAFQADLGKVFEGADVRLLAVTASVVALLLLITYRSPWLWLVPLTVVGIADRTALAAAETFSAASGIGVDGAITGITSVLVFGAGTNYALLLIARYREELRRHDSRHEAMRRAVGQAGPAILASSGTVILALASLGLADAAFLRGIGYVGALGLAVAVAFALLVLPSAMVLPGRWLFWPFMPRKGQADPTTDGVWARLGRAVGRRPVAVAVVSVLGLVALASLALGARTGLSQTEQFRDPPESVVAQERLAGAFPAGFSSPLRVATTPDDVDAVTSAAEKVGAVDVRPAGSQGDLTEVDVVLADAAGTSGSLATTRALRSELADVAPDALVGGEVAEDVDSRDASSRNRAVLVPVVLGILLLVLPRSMVATLLLNATKVLS